MAQNFGYVQTFEEQTAIDSRILTERFWDMFIVDALIGNWDRHNGNWGFLYNAETDSMELAPVYDCGSCLYPQADEMIMNSVLTNADEMLYRIYEIPTSAICLTERKLSIMILYRPFKIRIVVLRCKE